VDWIALSAKFRVKLSSELLNALGEIARKEGKDRATLREMLEKGIKEKQVEQAIELYQKGKATSWKAAQIADVSLWKFYEVLDEKGILMQYSAQDLERDLKLIANHDFE
jgi:predicted HTH domain antitoxin